jgi:hypothetical protein
MPDIKIIKLKLRRGLESQRLLITLDQGEMGYTIDSKRVFVGDGATVGGIIVGSRAFTPIASNKTSLAAYQGDLVVENSLLYQLTGIDATQTSSWRYIGPQIDNNTIKFNASNQFSINTASPALVFASGAIAATSQGLSARVDNSTIIISSNRLTVGTITNTRINVATLAGQGIGTTASRTLCAQVDNSSIQIISNVIALSSLYNASRLPLSSYGNAFGGFFNQALSGTRLGTTQYVASTGIGSATYTLSSAGFIVVDMGAPYGKKAIPVFDIPGELMALS